MGRAWSHREAVGSQVELWSRSCFWGYITTKMFSNILELSILLSICRALYACSAGFAELPVVLLYLLQSLVYHMLSKTRRSSGSFHRVIGEVLVLGLLVVVYKIPYSSCIRAREDVIGVRPS